MSMSKDLRVNVLPVPTWNKLKINDTVIKNARIDGVAKYSISAPEVVCDTKEKATKDKKALPAEILGNKVWNKAKEDSENAIADFFGEIKPVYLSLGGNEKEPVVIDIKCNKGQKSALSLMIDAKGDSEVILRMSENENDTYASKEDGGFLGLNISVSLSPGANLHLVQTQLLADSHTVFSYINGDCDDGSALKLTTVSLGAEKGYFGAKVKLSGDGSRLDTHTAYILEENRFIDMNYVADQYGKDTEAEIFSAGVLKKGCIKTSRQTVNFISGCAGSKGVENEEVLLLDDDVINKSAPLILCTEEDVEGEHGASIGQPDESVIFYLESRGIPLEQIYDMLSVAKINAAMSRTGHAETRDMVRQFMLRSE